MNEKFLTNILNKLSSWQNDDSDQSPIFVITPPSMNDVLERVVLLGLMKQGKIQKNVAYATSRLRIYAPKEFVISKMEGESAYYSRKPLSLSVRTRLMEEVLANIQDGELKAYDKVKDKPGFARQMGEFVTRYFEEEGLGLADIHDQSEGLQAKIYDVEFLAKKFAALAEKHEYSTDWGMFQEFKFDALDDYRFLLVRDSKKLSKVESNFYAKLQEQAKDYAEVTLEASDKDPIAPITKVVALDPDLEAKYVVDQIQQLAQTKQVKYSDIVVYLPLDSSYSATIAGAFNQAKIPYNMTQPAAIASLPLPTLLDSVLEEPARLYSVDNMLRLLKTRLITADFELDVTGEDKELIDTDEQVEEKKKYGRSAYLRYLDKLLPQVEDYLYKTGLQTRTQWENEWTILEERPDSNYAVIFNQNANLLRKATLNLIDAVEASTNLEKTLEDLEIIANHKALTQKSTFKFKTFNVAIDGLSARLSECLSRFKEISEYQSTTDREKLREQFKTLFADPFSGGHKARLNEVQIAAVTSSLVPNFKYGFIMGMDKLSFPGKLKPAEIFTLKEENELVEKTNDAYPLTGKKLQKEFLSSFAVSARSVSQALQFSYAQNSLDGTGQMAAKLFNQVGNADVKVIGLDEKNFTLAGFKLPFQVSHPENDAPAGWQKEFFDNNPKPLSPKLARKLYLNGEEAYVTSYSAINVYAKNPYEFFLKYGLRLRKKTKRELSNADIGTYTHTLLETSVNNFNEGNDLATTLQNVLSASDTSNHDGKHNEEILKLLASSDKNKWIQQRLNDIFKEYLFNMQQWQADQSELTTRNLGAELGFGDSDSYENDALVLPLDDEHNTDIHLSGMIDRYDLVEINGQNYVNVVDYKTGKSTDKVKKLEIKMNNGLELQLAIYAWALQELKQDIEAKAGVSDLKTGALTYSGVNNKSDDTPLYKGIISNELNEALETTTDKEAHGYSKQFIQDDIEAVVNNAKAQIKKIFTEVLDGNISMTPFQIGSDTGLKYNDYAEIMNFSEELGNHYNVIAGDDSNE
ncbi:PD-(D/E)XK nuclease family protein [Ligilactobacillus equi]|uniref:PD-(D/E)XK nuclease family protein n=1 Tax=Ligilactobacillus equi TaxID=137357 RepID=UPI002ED3F0C3